MSARLEDEEFVVDDATLVLLFGDPHEPLRRRALRRLQKNPTTTALRLALTWLEDPRVPHATATAMKLLDEAGDNARVVAAEVLDEAGSFHAGREHAQPRLRAWAASWAARTGDRALLARAPPRPPAPSLDLDDDDVRAARTEARRRISRGAALDDLQHSDDPVLRALFVRHARDAKDALRAFADVDPGVRAAARARVKDVAVAEFVDDNDVGAVARALMGIAPDGEDTITTTTTKTAPAPRQTVQQTVRTALGSTGVTVPKLIVSGANDVAASALARAVDAGANAFFWEPRYQVLTRFLRHREDVVVVAGSYEASARGIAADIARAQRLLGRRRLDVFLLFWARSDRRLDQESHAALAAAKDNGDVGAIGFSTHLRDLAVRAISESDEHAWDVVMTRHSAAHPGAADVLFPACAARGVAVFSFSATSYGRLLDDGVSALDCYAYSLAQPGVTAVISAPRTAGELDENLAVVDPALLSAGARAAVAGARREHLLTVAARVRQDSKDVLALVRRAPLPPAPAKAPLLPRNRGEVVDAKTIAGSNSSTEELP